MRKTASRGGTPLNGSFSYTTTFSRVSSGAGESHISLSGLVWATEFLSTVAKPRMGVWLTLRRGRGNGHGGGVLNGDSGGADFSTSWIGVRRLGLEGGLHPIRKGTVLRKLHTFSIPDESPGFSSLFLELEKKYI